MYAGKAHGTFSFEPEILKGSVTSHLSGHPEGSLRTGSVFRSISKYIATNPEVEMFQFENVTNLASKPSGKDPTGDNKKRKVAGPSNLSAVCYILEKEAGMWSHVFQVDSRSFGSGQQRQRLYGSCFRMRDLHMSIESAHELLTSTMGLLVGVRACHPDEYLLAENSPEIQIERGMHLMRSSQDDIALFCKEGSTSFRIDALFQCGGTLPCAFKFQRGGPKTAGRRLKAHSSDPTPPSPGAKWVKTHADEFRRRGEDRPLITFFLMHSLTDTDVYAEVAFVDGRGIPPYAYIIYILSIVFIHNNTLYIYTLFL